MQLRSNQLMTRYLDALGYDFQTHTRALPEHLEGLLDCDYLPDLDRVVLTKLNGDNKIPPLNTDLEKCEWEYNETHFHPDAYASRGAKELEYLELALESAKRLAEDIQKRFSSMRFRIQVAFSETEKNGQEIEFYGSSTVRLYRIRPACEDIMRNGDLDEFKTEALLEIET